MNDHLGILCYWHRANGLGCARFKIAEPLIDNYDDRFWSRSNFTL